MWKTLNVLSVIDIKSLKTLKISYIFDKTLVISIMCSSNDEKSIWTRRFSWNI